MEAELNSTAGAQWPQQALSALIEAQTMSEAVAAMLRNLDESLGCPEEAHIPLETIKACLMRLEASVDRAIDAAPTPA